MPSIKLNHFNVWTTDLRQSVQFYSTVVGLTQGARPAFRVPGAWLYDSTGTPVLHLVDVGSATRDELTEAGDRDLATLGGSGSIDHIAFEATDLENFRARVRNASVTWRETHFPAFDLMQIFISDPDGVQVELLFRNLSK